MLINRSEMFLGKTDQSQIDFVLYKRPFDDPPSPLAKCHIQIPVKQQIKHDNLDLVFSHPMVKSVQSALGDLLTTSAMHGTFSRPSTKRGLILIGLELNTNARESFQHC